MGDPNMSLALALAGGGEVDAEELDRLTAQLRRDLLQLDVDDVEPVREEEIPPGARPVDPVTLGALVVTLTPAVLQAVVSLVETWSRSRPVKSVKLTLDGDSIELGAADPQERERLVQLFVDKHAGR